ncbi:MAG: MarR family winged helix-turn-helix transcriptional regulator [Phycisphaeraceae bacterium]
MVRRQRTRQSTLPAPLTVSREALLKDGKDDVFRDLVHGLLAFTARLHAIRDGYARLIGLTGMQYTILISIAHLQARGEVGVSTIASHLHISGAFVTAETNKLVERALVEKRRGSTDRRRVSLHVTPAGRALLARLAPSQRQVNDTLFECLVSTSEMERLDTRVQELVGCADRALSLLGHLRALHEQGAQAGTAAGASS